MSVDKRRLIGPGGAAFVPNVDEQTVALMVASGEWTEVPAPDLTDPPKPKRAPRVRQAD